MKCSNSSYIILLLPWQGRLKFLQRPHNSADGQTHDVIEIAFDTADADDTDPFLDGIGAGFVEGVITIDITLDLGRCQVVKPDGSSVGKSKCLLLVQQSDTGDDLVS